MAVYKRHYKSHEGSITPDWSRFLVLSRYSLETLFESRLLIGFLVACYVFPLFSLGLIYLHHNASALALLNINVNFLLPINSEFFAIFMSVQGVFAFLLTAYAGPGLISPDLTNNALPLYLSRPISRAEYVLGKMAVLFIPLSCVTWIPGLILFFTYAGLTGNNWAWNNAHYAWAMLAGFCIWIVILSLLAMALSAWVRWKLAASALLFGIFFISAAFAEMINNIMRTKLGNALNLGKVMGIIWAKMLQVKAQGTIIGEMFDIRRGDELPQWLAWLVVVLICGLCVWMLDRRLRGREVVA
ncbi:MAG: ABC transporter permease [Bryobacteraceae bacterium]